MPMEKYRPEQIVWILRQIEVQTMNGKTAPQACNGAVISTQTYYSWRKEYGGIEGRTGQEDEGTGKRERSID